MLSKFIFMVFLSWLLLFSPISIVKAEVCDPSCSGIEECQKKINECQKLLEISVSATKPHEQRALELESQLSSLESNIKTLNSELMKKKVQISYGETKLLELQEKLNIKVKDWYLRGEIIEKSLGLEIIFTDQDINDKLSTLLARQQFVNRQKRAITGLAVDITDLTKVRMDLEQTQVWLSEKKISLEKTLVPVRALVKQAKLYQSQLSTTVGTLSARQQQLLAEKTGNFTTSVGDVPAADDPASKLDYNPGFSPAFAGFSFGAPHRKGMSQYGAYGRARSGHNAEKILEDYYGSGLLKKDYRSDINILVQGYGTYNLEEYVKRIYEVPNSWGDDGGFEALKAQAVAARSYALAYTANGSKSICATESCQVFKPSPKGGNWERAVNDTRGWVLVANGIPLSSWYAASSGGYNYSYVFNGFTTRGGWDTKCASQSCWTGDAFEKIANSPWFYKAWYRPRSSKGTRSHPWLNKEEFSDIVNASLLYQKDNGVLSHLGQVDKSNPDTWSKEEVRSRLGSDSVNEVKSISVTYSVSGYTDKVNVDTDKGNKSFSGADFRQIFNLRAPGEIWLASGLYNFEKK